jgi:hypothetical protein
MPPFVNHYKQEICTGFIYVLRDGFVATVEPFGVSAATTVAMTFSVSILMYMFMSAVA